MGNSCCNNLKINQSRVITIENYLNNVNKSLNKEESKNNNNNLEITIDDGENNEITKNLVKKSSGKRVSRFSTNQKIKNKIDIKASLKIKNIKNRRRSFAIPMDNRFKDKFLYQKKLSLNSNKNFSKNSSINSNKNHDEKIYLVPPNKKKSLFKLESNLNCDNKTQKENELKDSNLIETNSKLKLDSESKLKSISISPQSPKEKKKHLPIEIINKEITSKQKDLIIKVLNENELITNDMDESFINMILNTLIHKRIKDNVIFFDNKSNLGDFYYVIEKGKIEYAIDNEIYELTKLNGIGTQSLLNNSKQKCYIKAVGRCYLFELSLEKYRKYINDYEKKQNEEKFWHLKKHFFFAFIKDESLNKLVKVCPIINYHKHTTIVECDSFMENIYYIIFGDIKAKRNDIIIKDISEGEIFGEIGLFNSIESLYEYYSENECSLIEISYENMFLYIGEDCVQKFVYDLFNDAIKNDEFLSYCFTKQIISSLYHFFQLKFYYNDTIVARNQKKIILPISGTVIKSKKLAPDISNILELIQKKNKNRLITGKFNTDSVTTDVNIMYNLIGDESIIFECDWYEILPTILTNNLFSIYKLDPFELIQSFRNISLFRYISPYKMFQLMNILKEKKFKKGQIILKDGPKSNQFFYIFNGEVNLNINGVNLKQLSKGQSFGDITSDISNYNQKTNFICKGSQAILFYLDKDNYNEIVNKSDFYLRLRKIIDKNDLSISLNNLYYIKDLGRGSFGKVYLVHNKKNLFALKSTEINAISENKEYASLILNEKTIMSQIEHPYIVRLNDTFKTRDYLFFLMEYINGINMRKYLELKDNKNLRNLQEIKFLGGILFLVLNYLSKKKIIHRDLKPDNLMIDSNGFIKVIDFGMAKILKDTNYTNTITGTPHYMSPEVILSKPYSFDVDFWSVGVILYEIFYGRVPFGYGNDSINDIYQDIIENNLHLPSVKINESFNNLLKCLLNKIPSNRISGFNMIKNHIFFKNFDFDGLLKHNFEAPFKPENNVIIENVYDLIKKENVSLLNFMKTSISQSASDIDENFMKSNEMDNLFVNF